MTPIIFQYDGDDFTAVQRLQDVGATEIEQLAPGFISAKIDIAHIPTLDQYGRVEIKKQKQPSQ